MVYVPGGEFLRGRSHSLPDDDMKRRPTLLKDDRPTRKIQVGPFYLDEHEVTNEAYRRFLEATGQQPPFHWVDGEIAKGDYAVILTRPAYGDFPAAAQRTVRWSEL